MKYGTYCKHCGDNRDFDSKKECGEYRKAHREAHIRATMAQRGHGSPAAFFAVWKMDKRRVMRRASLDE